MCSYPTYDPKIQTLFNYLELMKAHFIASDVLQEERQVGIILSHIPTEYFDSLVASSASFPVSDLSLADLELKLIFILQNSEKVEGKDSPIENPRGSSIENLGANMLNTFSRNGDIHHVRVSPDVSSLGRNSTTILNNFLNSGDFHHAAVLPVVSSLSGNRLWLPKRIRETCSGEMDKGAVCTRKDGYIGAIEKVGIPTIKIIFPLKIGYKGAICTRRDGYIGAIEKLVFQL